MVYNWDEYKDVITRLYVQENKPVDEIMRYMSRHYDFKPRYVRLTPGLHLGFVGTATRSPVRRCAVSPAGHPPLGPEPGARSSLLVVSNASTYINRRSRC